MGEKSKSTGEAGEIVAKKILEMIGWKNLLEGYDIKCLHPLEHQIKQSKRRTHGLDFFASYESPLINHRLDCIPVSMKYRKEYPKKNPTSEFKDFIIDISGAKECLKYNNIANLKKTKAIKQKKFSGVILWLAYNDEQEADIIERITDFRSTETFDNNYGTVYLVDNKRANFILGIFDFLKNSYSDYQHEFFYPKTSYQLNQDITTIRSSGEILPLQFINSSVIPIKLIKEQKGDSEEMLVLFSITGFDRDHFKRFVGMSYSLTVGWGNKIIFCFPDYHKLTHEHSISEVLHSFEDQKYANKIEVRKFSFGDFRKLED